MIAALVKLAMAVAGIFAVVKTVLEMWKYGNRFVEWLDGFLQEEFDIELLEQEEQKNG